MHSCTLHIRIMHACTLHIRIQYIAESFAQNDAAFMLL